MMKQSEPGQTKFESMDADEWAGQVVGDLSKANPPHQVWRGSNARLVRFGALMPIGTFDNTLLKLSGFDEVGKALAAGQRKA